MGRMIFDLTDEDREALERVRAKLGLRSHAETLRTLVRERDTPVDQPGRGHAVSIPPRPELHAAAIERAKAAVSASSVPLAGTFERKPLQKGQKR